MGYFKMTRYVDHIEFNDEDVPPYYGSVYKLLALKNRKTSVPKANNAITA